MQKLITVSVDTNQLSRNPNHPFSINEIESVNDLLEQGWEIEHIELMKSVPGEGEVMFLAVLNDDAMFDHDNELDDEFGFDNDEDDFEDEEDEEDFEEKKNS